MKTGNEKEELVDLLCHPGIQASMVKDTIQVSSCLDVLINSRIFYKKGWSISVSKI